MKIGIAGRMDGDEAEAAATVTSEWRGRFALIGRLVVAETEDGFEVVAECRSREAAEAAFRLLAS